MTTRGLSLNNPANLFEYPSINWDGEIKPTTDPLGKLCQFTTLSYGIRAAAINFRNYQLKDGCKTLTDIISRCAPPRFVDPQDANNTAQYISFVAQGMDVGATDTVDLTNNATLARFLRLQAHFEQGFDCLTDYQVGLAMAMLS